LIATVLVDFFVWHATVFITVTHFLVLFQAFKAIGPKERKDCLQLFLFGFFQILAACTLSVDAWHALILLLLIPSAAAALFWNQAALNEETAGEPPPASAQGAYRRLAAFIGLAALPMNVILTIAIFIVFPRLTLNATVPGFGAMRSGYTEQVNLAQPGTIATQNAAALWLSLPSQERNRHWNGYLRGATLELFNGLHWLPARDGPSRVILPDRNGVFVVNDADASVPHLRQVITLVDTSAATLFASGEPLRVIAPLPSLQRQPSGALRWTASWRRPLRYEVLAAVAHGSRGPTGAAMPRHLELPAAGFERVAPLARRIAGRGSSLDQARNIESYLRTQYRYSVEVAPSTSPNPVDDFLFHQRQGPCGHFASAMAVMLRLQGIPCRLAAGYLRGEWNEPAQQYLFRQRDAHAWVEAYIEGKGWMLFDPSPRRPDTGAMEQRLQMLRQYWDFLGYRWNRLVVQYDLYAQMRAFQSLRSSSDRVNHRLGRWLDRWRWRNARRPTSADASRRDGTSGAPIPWKGLLIVVAITAAFALRARLRPDREPRAVERYRRFLRRMAREGFPKSPTETGREFALRLVASRPEIQERVWQATEEYYRRRFAAGTRLPAGGNRS
jgi:transglutaminase-like putative cysteine protease